MKKLAKRTIGITIALAFAVATPLLVIIAMLYLVAYMNNMR
jgi:phosphoglycerate-specific signal transduction histidine kinase